jgi:hypothetical protein
MKNGRKITGLMCCFAAALLLVSGNVYVLMSSLAGAELELLTEVSESVEECVLRSESRRTVALKGARVAPRRVPDAVCLVASFRRLNGDCEQSLRGRLPGSAALAPLLL